MQNKQWSISLSYVISIAVGAGIWIGISNLAGKVEAWDSPYYFQYGLPFLVITTGVLGFIAPARPWRWGILVMVSQAAVAFIQNPTANLLPLGLVVFGILSIPCVISAYIGAYISSRRRE